MQTMQKVHNRLWHPQYISKYLLYVSPEGELVVIVGNQSVVVTPQEARNLLEYSLGYAEKFVQNGEPDALPPTETTTA